MVVRPAGVIAAAVISVRSASTIDGLHNGFFTDPRFEHIVEQDLATGRHENPDQVRGWFTTAYFHDPDRLQEDFAQAGFVVTDVIAIEGPTAGLANIETWLDDAERLGAAPPSHPKSQSEPSLLGASQPHPRRCLAYTMTEQDRSADNVAQPALEDIQPASTALSRAKACSYRAMRSAFPGESGHRRLLAKFSWRSTSFTRRATSLIATRSM